MMEQAKYTILPNGLKVIIRNMPLHRSLTLIVVVGAGPRFEDDNTSGLAHFLEHMLFEGTSRFNSPKKLAEYIESKGGRSWAFTEKESVNYGVKVKKENYELAISYLNEILFNSLLHKSEIEKEKRIITEEIKKKMDNPEMEVWENYFSFIFGEKNSLGRSTLGSLSSIENLNRDKIKKYLDEFYFPGNMTLVAVGDVNEKEFVSKVKKIFPNRSKHIQNLNKNIISSKFNGGKKLIEFEIAQSQFILGFVNKLNKSSRDIFSFMLIAEILGNSSSSRIFQKLVYELGIAYSSWNYYSRLKNCGIFSVGGAMSPGNVPIAIKSVAEEIYKIKKIEISKQELNNAKERLIAQLYFSLETTDSLAYYYAQQAALEDEIIDPEELENQVKKISSKDIRKVAERCFRADNLNLVVRGEVKKFETQISEEFDLFRSKLI